MKKTYLWPAVKYGLGIVAALIEGLRLLFHHPAVKYGLGIVVLALVIWRNWSSPPVSGAELAPNLYFPTGCCDDPALLAQQASGAVALMDQAQSGGQGLSTLLVQPIQVTPLTLATLIYLVGLMLTFWRWHVLVRAQNLPFTRGNAVRLGLISFFLSNFIPAGSIGGDIAKAAFIAREQTRRTVAVSTVLIDRAVGLWGLIWLVVVVGSWFWAAGNPAIQTDKSLKSIGLPGGWAVQITPPFIIMASAAIVGFTLVLWLFLTVLPTRRAERFAGRLSRIPKLGHSAAEFWRAVWMYRCQRRSIVVALLLALAGHVCFVMAFYYAAQVFQSRSQIPSLAEHFLLVPIGMTFMALFPSPGGVGGGEWAFGELYALINPNMRGKGVAAMLTQRVIIWGLSMVGYFIFLQMRPALRPAAKEERPQLALAEAS